jgi:hypothetical protein
MHVAIFSMLRSAMVSKHSELTKRQARDHYGIFSSPSSCITPPPSRQEVGSSSRRCIAPPGSCQEEASSDDSMEMWVVAPPPPPLHLQVAPPPPTRLVPPPPTPLTRLGDSSLISSGYNDRCPHVREVSSYEHYF